MRVARMILALVVSVLAIFGAGSTLVASADPEMVHHGTEMVHH
jgi:hypothetical protein